MVTTRRLMVIGGGEQKASEGCRAILEEVVAATEDRRLVVMTVASTLPVEGWEEYRDLFRELGVSDVRLVDVRQRTDAYDAPNVATLADGATCFLTGGDQLRITSQLGGSPVGRRLSELYRDGSVICGTSAGAAAMPDTMLIGGPGNRAADVSTVAMAPGMGLLSGLVLDSHFAERGRMGRILAAVAQNPSHLGIGIDEDTAIIVTTKRTGASFRVLGTGAVHVVDGTHIDHADFGDNLGDGVAVCNVVLHVLRDGDGFDLDERRPLARTRDRHEDTEQHARDHEKPRERRAAS